MKVSFTYEQKKIVNFVLAGNKYIKEKWDKFIAYLENYGKFFFVLFETQIKHGGFSSLNSLKNNEQNLN